MTIEYASARIVHKPWGSTDLRPWSKIHDDKAVGELWFQRANLNAPDPALLLKLLFTKEPLSIQVHPDDAFAQSIGLANGKSEAWYILSAAPGAKVAIGLKRPVKPAQLRSAIEDGSIAGLIQWRRVAADEIVFVPAGAIHAIGAGLVIAEIQQRSEATFRLFDYGRGRELHLNNAVAAAHTGPADPQPAQERLSDARTLLISSPHFIVERIVLAPKSSWDLHAESEAWLFAVKGDAQIGPVKAIAGEAAFIEEDDAEIRVGANGFTGLLAYPGPKPIGDILHNLTDKSALAAVRDVSRPRQPALRPSNGTGARP
ncbi:class I mannose-6-phosphate isomerase [Methylocella silvestris]|uniref:Mannose-6-phosphate isomerase n=1 Tax=Methylocella silvestris TaxID=199596 RepID=A0A2J7TE10_METSI|nr:class I mannose-6-phosphate isomerase [Methylocella silvestris]PNG25001.1 mannose-6-phosphate isomerase [Methylocella silvestris]